MDYRPGVVGGYTGWVLAVHIILTLLTFGSWAPILITYLICARERKVNVYVDNYGLIREFRTK